MPASLYDRVVAISQFYLGPAGERFVKRIISFHLNKEPQQLSARDIPKLTEWFKVSLGLLTADKKLVDECGKKLLKLKAKG